MVLRVDFQIFFSRPTNAVYVPRKTAVAYYFCRDVLLESGKGTGKIAEFFIIFCGKFFGQNHIGEP